MELQATIRTQQRRLVSAIARGPDKHQSFALFKEAIANW